MPKVPIAKFPLESKALLVAQPLANGSVQTFSSCFPVGKGAGETWERLRMRINVTLGVGVQTFPVEAGVYNFIRNVRLETSDGETICDCPGTSLYLLNWWLEHHNPWHTPVAAANAAYEAILDIPFGYSNMRKPEDGYLDSGAYSALYLTIQTGAYAAGAVAGDLGVSNAAGTQVATMDLSIIRTKAGMFNNEEVKPLYVPYIKFIGSRVPDNANQRFDLERADDLALFGFLLAEGSVARAPFDHVVAATGLTAETDNITSVSMGDNVYPAIVDRKLLGSFRNERHRDMNGNFPLAIPVVPNIPTVSLIGKYWHNFVQDGSAYGAYPTANKSESYITYLGGAGGTSQTDCLVWGFRRKRRMF
jgi:hypothetical protein